MDKNMEAAIVYGDYWDMPFGGLRVEEVSVRRLRGHI